MDLKTKLSEIYGSFAEKVFNIYAESDPLSTVDKHLYWTSVNLFLEQLHNILYKKAYKYSLSDITTDNYFFIVQVCVLNSFDIFNRIEIMNKRDKKPCKAISNRISHELLHDYLTYLKQIPNHYHYLHGSDPLTDAKVNVHPTHVPPHPHQPHPQPYFMPHPSLPPLMMQFPPMFPMPPGPQYYHMMQYYYQQPQFLQQCQPQPPQMHFVPTSGASTMPTLSPLPQAKQPLITKRITKITQQGLITKNPFFRMNVSVGTNMNDDTPCPPREDFPSLTGTSTSTPIPIPIPTHSATDNIPLNFYTVFGNGSSKMSDYFKSYNKPPDAHKIPNLHPVPVHPPPP